MSLTGHTLSLIKEAIPTLKGNNLKIAKYCLEHPRDISSGTIAQFSKKISISESGIIRFTQELGFTGFSSFKMSLIESLASNENLIEDTPISLDCTEAEKIALSIFQQASLQLQKTAQMLDETLFQKTVDWISNCDQLVFYAVGTSSFLAEDAAYRFMRVGLPAKSATDPHIMLFSAKNLTKNSVAIAISHTGRSKETIEAMKIAKESGATTISITSTRNSRITKICEHNFVTSDASQVIVKEAITSRISHITLLDSLFTAIMVIHYNKFEDKLQEVHDILENARY